MTALSDMSAAKAEAETIVSALANSTIFFMTIPTRLNDQSDLDAPTDKR